ncbi:hypothetical protein E2R51_03585 [Jeotgalibacillus sp. S-D1]|uniref:CAP domain-containing protein n=1 Tax=Jeotgalibacillus sp. S-D1 TaxID=2552189 RepID=UPI00105988DB|nr:CAP domain-containing protein [Jeotgalibacillus sp. S-D1]TDL34815.1 hypothetical protein E2R51_03585 [Jeotgalibacillus sp. S-D1]
MKGKSLIISGAAAFALLISPAANTQASSGDAQPQIQKQQNIEWAADCLAQGQFNKGEMEKVTAELKKYNIDINELKEQALAQAAPQQKEAAAKAPEKAQEEAPQPKEEAQAAQPKEETQPAQAQEQEVKENDTAEKQDASDVSNFEQQVVELTNAERAKEGLPALELDTELSKVAKDKSADMQENNYFSHTSPTHGSPFDMMKSYGIDYSSAGENIAMGQASPEEVVEAWMNSEGHRKNIMSSSYTHIGVGHVENGNYWTQMFISK